MAKSDPPSLSLNTVINKALHIMAAHLHRYNSELERLETVLQELLSHHAKPLHTESDDDEDDNSESTRAWCSPTVALRQLLSQLRAIRAFDKELEGKIENILRSEE